MVPVQEAVRSRPAYADAYTGMGISLKELKRREEAEACFQQVVRLRPGCALSLGNFAGAALGVLHALGIASQCIIMRPCWPQNLLLQYEKYCRLCLSGKLQPCRGSLLPILAYICNKAQL